ncbi:hypothetical protein ACHAXR_011614 [Thalassiosira sp. AJA248-18]
MSQTRIVRVLPFFGIRHQLRPTCFVPTKMERPRVEGIQVAPLSSIAKAGLYKWVFRALVSGAILQTIPVFTRV